MKTAEKVLFTFVFIFVALSCLADKPYPSGNQLNINGSVLGMEFDKSTGNYNWRPISVDSEGNLTIQAEVDTKKIESTVASISEDVISQRQIIASISEELKATEELVSSISARLDSVTVAKSMTHRLVSVPDSSASAINGSIPEGMEDRMIVEIKAQNGQPFYLGFNSSVDDTNGRKVTGAIMLTVSHSQGIFVYQNTGNEIKLDVTEGWK